MQDAHDPYLALRHRDFSLLLSSNVLAALSAEIQFTVVEWEIYQRTNSKAMMAYGGLAQFLPLLLLALPAGQAADRFSRKYMLMIAHALMALSSVGLAVVSQSEGPVECIFIFLAIAGVSRAIGMPSRSSLLSLVVPVEAVPNAVTWVSSGWQVAATTGPAIGGLLVGSPSSAYVATAVGLCFCMAMVAWIEPRPAVRSTEPRSLRSLFAGIGFVWRTELLLAAITLDLFAVLLGGCTAMLPVYCQDILEVEGFEYGILRASPALGAFAMAIFLAHRPPLARPGLALIWSVAAFGLATIGFALSTNFYLSFAMLFLTGAFDNISVVVRGTLMQVLTPDDMRGRVGAVNSVFISSTNQLGAFESGITAEWFGLVPAVAGGGVGTLAVVAVAAFLWPNLRSLPPLHTLKTKESGTA